MAVTATSAVTKTPLFRGTTPITSSQLRCSPPQGTSSSAISTPSSSASASRPTSLAVSCLFVKVFIFYYEEECLAGWMDGWIDGCLAGWLDGWMDGWMNGCLAVWQDVWMDG